MPIPGIVFVQAPDVYLPPPADPFRSHYILWWEGWDGSNWSLSDQESGLVLMRGVRGLGRITQENHRDEHASLAGSRFRDFRATNREIFLPIHLYSDGDSDAWVKHNRAFSRTMRAGTTGWIHIIHPDGEHRKIQARYDKGMEEAYELDPAFYGWATYGIYLTAEQPYWEAVEPVTDSWKVADPVYFFGGGSVPGNAPAFGISNKQNISTATITNPGDVETSPVWTVHGPTTTANVGVDGRVIGVPFEIEAGQWVVIDTRPDEQTAILHDGGVETDVTHLLSSFDFEDIPAGDDVQLDIELTGIGGTVDIALTPLYEWGLS